MLWLNDPRTFRSPGVILNLKEDAPPSYNFPNISIPSASDLYSQGQNWFQNNGYGGLLNAQSNALSNANNPDYYSRFQPTSFEQALGNQYFQNVWPDEQALIRQQFSQSGLSSSPALAETEGRAYGNLGTQVGSYLSDQANQRAMGSINAGLGINPMSFLSPFAQQGSEQSGQQANLATAQANAQYQNALANYQYNQQQNQGIGGLIGAGVGGVAGAFAGNPLAGASLGSQIGTGFGGGTMNPQALAMSGMQGGFQNPFGGGTSLGNTMSQYNSMTGGNSAQPGRGGSNNNGWSFSSGYYG